MNKVLEVGELLLWIVFGGFIAFSIYAVVVLPSMLRAMTRVMEPPPYPPSEVPEAKDETPCAN